MSVELIRSSAETLNWSCVSAGEEKPSIMPFTNEARQAIKEHMATFHTRSPLLAPFMAVLMAEGRGIFSDASQLLLGETD
jgi:hypothetical protein